MARWNTKKIIASGLIGGASMLAVQMILGPLVQAGSIGAPLRASAAIVLGPDVLASSAGAALGAAGVFAVGLAVHAALSVSYAALLDVVVRRLVGAQTVAAGAVFGIAVYAVNLYGFVGLFPWFAEARGLLTVLAHVTYGALAATALDVLAPRRERLTRSVFT